MKNLETLYQVDVVSNRAPFMHVQVSKFKQIKRYLNGTEHPRMLLLYDSVLYLVKMILVQNLNHILPKLNSIKRS